MRVAARELCPPIPGSVYEAFCSRISRTHLRPTRAPPIQHRRSAAVRRESASPPDVGPRKLHHWRSPARFVLTRPILVSCSTYVKAGGKMKQPTLAVLNRSRERAAIAPDGRKGAAGLVWAAERAEPPVGQNRVKKQLRVGAARWLCPGHRSERSARLDRYVRDLLAPARCAELPPAAREAGALAAETTPRRAAQPADGVVASHRAADGAGPSIEGARTCAHGTTTGAAAVSRAF